MKSIIQYGFTSLLIIITAIFLYLAKDWNFETGLFPRVVGFPMLLITIAILVVDIKKGLRQNKNAEAENDAEFKTTNLRMLKYVTWLIGFVFFVWAIGIKYTIPIYIFSYMKIEGKYGWLKCGIYAIAMTVFVTILFEYIFRVAWPEGALLRILNI